MSTTAEHFNQLTPAELERLAILQEEMGESIQVIGKILRHGYQSHNPNDPTRQSNRHMLIEELSHVWFAMELMGIAEDINPAIMRTMRRAKAEKIGKWTHHQPKQLLDQVADPRQERM